VAEHPDSPTGAFLSGRQRLPVRPTRTEYKGELVVRGARVHNLHDLTVRIPLGRLVAVTGVSGSGKSSLMFDILDLAARQRFYGGVEAPGAHDCIEGWEYIDRVVTVDQTPIGRIPRSNAATYTEIFTPIREAFAGLEAARSRALGAKHFSFNVPGGRCERCEGAGVLTVNMHFLPDVQVRCPVCRGRRYKKEVLAVKYRGADIASVLEMTIEEALALFAEVPAIAGRLSLMAEVGLGYLQLGQPATTLSGGEAQRVKLAKELARSGAGRALYLLDEPTTGLHPADITRLLALLQRLVDGSQASGSGTSGSGNSVVVVEHHLELIRCADWLIDLGPEGGLAGGRLIAEGTPEQVAQVPDSHTGRCLKDLLDVDLGVKEHRSDEHGFKKNL
jgi:excinuclease ABC subunit A